MFERLKIFLITNCFRFDAQSLPSLPTCTQLAPTRGKLNTDFHGDFFFLRPSGSRLQVGTSANISIFCEKYLFELIVIP